MVPGFPRDTQWLSNQTRCANSFFIVANESKHLTFKKIIKRELLEPPHISIPPHHKLLFCSGSFLTYINTHRFFELFQCIRVNHREQWSFIEVDVWHQTCHLTLKGTLMGGSVPLWSVGPEIYTIPISHLISLRDQCSLMDGSPPLEGEHLEYLDYVSFIDVISVPDIDLRPSWWSINTFQMNESMSEWMNFSYLPASNPQLRVFPQ